MTPKTRLALQDSRGALEALRVTTYLSPIEPVIVREAVLRCINALLGTDTGYGAADDDEITAVETPKAIAGAVDAIVKKRSGEYALELEKETEQ